jgi:hypothetical protein
MARKKQPVTRDAVVEEARKRFDYAVEVWTPIYARCTEDMRFSDPTDPQQWPEAAKRERTTAAGGARPTLVFDQTQQHVRQVINTARRNKPAMTFLPVDDDSDIQLAEVLQGLARQTEYDSRAVVAYITGLNQATRGGIGYFRLVLEEIKGHAVKGQLCAKIKRVVDFRSVWPDPDFTEPDGSDMGWGFVEDQMARDTFERKYPKARIDSTDAKGWFSDKHVRIVECYRLIEKDGKTVCEHFKMSGEEILIDADGNEERSEFPGEFVPIFPVLGNEEWDEGKRRLSGCIRLARDAQITYNYERNSEFEAVAVGPKAPWAGPADAFEPYKQFWDQANKGNLAYLPYATIDENGNPIPFKPERVQPAGIATGWTQLSQRSKQDIQAALGGFESGVGNNPNDQSGRAVLALQDRQDVGTYHYVDNLALSIAHCGRVLTQVWPVIYDQAQVLRIIGEDDDPSFVQVDPKQKTGYAERKDLNGKKVVSINPGVGKYDVRAVVGPAFQTRQAETAAELGEFINGNPQMLSLLGDVLVKARNYPDAEKLAKRFQLMLPPQIQQAEQSEEDQQQIPPQVMAALQQAQQEIQGLRQALQESQSGMATKQMEVQGKLQQTAMSEQSKQQLAQMQIESTERIAALNADVKRDMGELAGAIQLMAKKLEVPLSLGQEVEEDLGEPEEAKPDPMMLLAQAIGQMNTPKRKRLAIQAPSGEVYQGMVEDEGPEPMLQ